MKINFKRVIKEYEGLEIFHNCLNESLAALAECPQNDDSVMEVQELYVLTLGKLLTEFITVDGPAEVKDFGGE